MGWVGLRGFSSSRSEEGSVVGVVLVGVDLVGVLPLVVGLGLLIDVEEGVVEAWRLVYT